MSDISQAARTYGERAATALMDKRKGHGGGPIARRVLSRAELIALAAIAFDAGRASLERLA
jgi:hypothetical protein